MNLSPHARAMLAAIAASAASRMDATDDAELVALLTAENPDLDRLVSALLRSEAEARAFADSLKGYAVRINEREAALRQKVGNIRLTLMNIMDSVGVRQWRTAEATISLRDGKPGVVIIEEAAIPPEYVRTTIRPDIAAIKEAIDAGQEIPGVAVANGTPSISIRTR